MGRIVERILVNCPPARIWRLLEKHLEHPEISPIQQDPGDITEQRGEALTSQRDGIGTRTRWYYNYREKPFVWDDIVTEWEPGKRVAWRTTSAWDMDDSFTLFSREKGTLVSYNMSYRLPYGPLGAIYGKLLLEPRMRKHLDGVLRRMKRLCEAPFTPEVQP